MKKYKFLLRKIQNLVIFGYYSSKYIKRINGYKVTLFLFKKELTVNKLI